MTMPRDTQLERLFFIEYLAIFIGQVTRKDLVSRFGISEPAATKDFARYADLVPNVLRYDLRRKCYVLNECKPFFQHDVEQSLYSLAGERAIGVDSTNPTRLENWLNLNIRRPMSLDVASAITRSIHLKLCVDAEYLSLSSGNSIRKLSPIALVNDGQRWHARCYDHAHQDFRDFLLTRFSKVHTRDRSSISIADDNDWRQDVVLELVPHPKATHPETIRMDFDLPQGVKYIRLKRCLVGYFLKHWHIDTSDDGSGNPRAQQLYLKNREEIISQGIASWAFD